MRDLTLILDAVKRGDTLAGEELLTAVYQELRQIAAAKMSMESPGHTLQPTALVHEAWSRIMVGAQPPGFACRAHFFAAAGEAMRRILIEGARRRATQKRGGGLTFEPMDGIDIPQETPSDEMLALNEALDELAREDPVAADLVKLRYFVGMTMTEAADALEIPLRTGERVWNYARAWLRRRIQTP